MAVFMVNICKFNGCGITFQSLGDLIHHIEDTHIDYDPRVVEKQEEQHPLSLPLSYVLRFFTDAARKEIPDIKPKIKSVIHHGGSHSNHGHIHALSNKQGTPSIVANRSSSPTGSEADEDEVMTDSEDSNDSWTTPEEFSSEFILRYGSRSTPASPSNPNQNPEKPFACPVPGCKKRYKNVNGIKYHSKNGHKNDGKIRKAYKCHCGKSYKTGQGLKVHTAIHHAGANLTTFTTQNGEVIQVPTRDVTAALHPIRTVTLKPLVTTSGLGVNVGSLSSAIGLPVKTLQGVVVSTKTVDGCTSGFGLAAALATKANQGVGNSQSKAAGTIPALVTPQKPSGLFINTLNVTPPLNVVTGTESAQAATSPPSITASAVMTSSGLGILTPASSPQTPPPTPEGPNRPASRTSSSSSPTSLLQSQQTVSLPLTPVSPANTPPLSVELSE